MSNPFYNPTSNPGFHAFGLSANVRTEFALIGAGFDALPKILTTGNFVTTFAQLGSLSFTLPDGPGTLARTSDIAFAVGAEATDRAAGDDANAAAIVAEATTRATADTANASAITAETTRATDAEALLAPKASPTLTGTPAAPTATAGTNTTQLATTAFVAAATAAFAASIGGTWHNVGGVRVIGTTYTNPLTYPTPVLLTIPTSLSGQTVAVTVNGVVISSFSAPGAGTFNFNFSVPAGQTYSVASSTVFTSWFEFW